MPTPDEDPYVIEGSDEVHQVHPMLPVSSGVLLSSTTTVSLLNQTFVVSVDEFTWSDTEDFSCTSISSRVRENTTVSKGKLLRQTVRKGVEVVNPNSNDPIGVRRLF